MVSAPTGMTILIKAPTAVNAVNSPHTVRSLANPCRCTIVRLPVLLLCLICSTPSILIKICLPDKSHHAQLK